MLYNNDFDGLVEINPPLNKEEIEFLVKFNETRRIDRGDGDPYCVDDSSDRSGMSGYDSPVGSQPGVYCQWIPSDDGVSIEWDKGRFFSKSEEWMKYIVDHFIGSDPIAKKHGLDFLQGHDLSGTIIVRGEDREDNWALAVRGDDVFTRQLSLSYNGSPIVEVESLDIAENEQTIGL